MKNYKFDGNVYELIENKVYPFIMVLIFGLTTAYFVYSGERSSDIPFWVFCLLPMGIFLYKLGRKVIFVSSDKTMDVLVFGLSIQKSSLTDFKDLLIVNHKAYYFLNNGKEVICVFNTANKTLKEISIIRKNNFKELDVFLNETKNIISTIASK